MINVNFDHCKVGFRVCSDHFCVVLHARWIAFNLYADAISLVHDVLVGNYVAFWIDNYARSEGMFRPALAVTAASEGILPALPALSAEKAVKKIAKWVLITGCLWCSTTPNMRICLGS